MTADSTLEDIPREECLQLLRAMAVGRIAVAMPGQAPLVVPVNYVVDGETVVFRSDEGSKVAALRVGPVAFETDFVDPVHRTGWSVLIRGVAYEATQWEIEHVGLESWVSGPKAHWVRIVPESITGRRIRVSDVAFDSRGYL